MRFKTPILIWAIAVLIWPVLASAGPPVSPLTALKDHFRVLVVSAPAAGDAALALQDQWLRAAEPGLRDRDMVVVMIVGREVQGPPSLGPDAAALRGATGLPADRFGVALIGKDGSEALRRSEPIRMEALFATIDAMPMRREEMARRRPQG